MDTPAHCARHPGRPALTICARCGRGVCAEDLVDAPVGYQCLDCADSAPAVRRLSDPASPTPLTRLLVGSIVAVALLASTGAVDARTFGLVPALVGAGQWWRLGTSALLHAGLVHLAFNGLLLWNLGQLLERTVGTARLAGFVVAGTAGGGFGVVAMSWLGVATGLRDVPVLGALLITGPMSVTVGASGAVFGLMGSVLAMMRRRGIDWASNEIGSSIVSLVALNLVLTFAIPAISVGGHVGGLLGGWAAGHLAAAPGTSRRAGALRALLLGLVLLVAGITLAQDLLRRLVG
jgi:membrane associated rhomboid family serine protease